MLVKFLKSNWLYILWATIYIFIAWLIFGATWVSFFFVTIAYAISITIALSPIGEALLRLTQGARKIQTKKELEYLKPIFDEVYQSSLENNPSFNKNVELYTDNSIAVNAYAVGRQTIVLTKGAIEAFSEEELKGVLAHEFGHLSNGDTKALLLNFVGNGIFTLIIMAMRIIMFITELIYCAIDRSGILKIFMLFVKFIFEMGIFLFILLGQIILSINSRQNEYNADKFAFDSGFGSQLTEALYMLQDINTGRKISLLDRLKSSHPHISSRIARLEGLIDEQEP